VIYVAKPRPLEACKFDSVEAALTWLQPGEFSVVQKDAIYIEVGSPASHLRVPVDGSRYVIRAEFGLLVAETEAFEDEYIPLAAMDDCQFTAEGDDENGWVVSCGACGPLGVVDAQEDLAVVAMEHITEEHTG
jgi:hypothetical protein